MQKQYVLKDYRELNNYMVMFELTEVITGDGLILEGIVSRPVTGTFIVSVALINIHGLGGKFYGSPARINTLAKECDKRKFGFFSFNTRGHDTISRINTVSAKTGNANNASNTRNTGKINGWQAYEKFEDCIFDIDAVISEALRRGHEKIFLLGHSTGANKIVYYLHKKPDAPVTGLILSGPVSDVPGIKKDFGKRYAGALEKARKMVSTGKGNELLPTRTTKIPLTAQRFISLANKGSTEDVFQYHRKKSKFVELAKIEIPTLAILGKKDEYADRTVSEILATYRQANPKIETKIMRGATHSFDGKEKKYAEMICEWIGNQVRV